MRCKGMTRSGEQCRREATEDGYCKTHHEDTRQCKGITRFGEQCKRGATEGEYCKTHQENPCTYEDLGPKRAPGRPKVQWDEDQWKFFDLIVGCIDLTQEDIARAMGCDLDTVDAICRRERDISFSDLWAQRKSNFKSKLAVAQYQAALEGNPTALIWLGKQWLGQSDKSKTEISGPKGGPVQIIKIGDKEVKF